MSDKEKFLKEEYKHYKQFRDYKHFINVIGDDVVPCDTCGKYYWRTCAKRCNCK